MRSYIAHMPHAERLKQESTDTRVLNSKCFFDEDIYDVLSSRTDSVLCASVKMTSGHAHFDSAIYCKFGMIQVVLDHMAKTPFVLGTSPESSR